MAKMSCWTCIFWQRDQNPEKQDSNWGTCHRLPPTHVLTAIGLRSFHPLTKTDDWCGEHTIEVPVIDQTGSEPHG